MASVKLSGLTSVLGRNVSGLQSKVQPIHFAVLSRGISGKLKREHVEKPKPFPYKKMTYNLFYSLFDKTSSRFDENTKIVVVEGAHAVGKSKLAQELAEELDMLYVPQPSMDFYYKSPYGHVDVRDYNHLLMPRSRTYDEKDFARDPFKVDGCVDRYAYMMYQLKFTQYFMALRHLFNTGQGVVLEANPCSYYTDIDAFYNAGYVDRSSLSFYDRLMNGSLHFLLRPNLIVYLDAPVDVVQKKIKERGNEWDQNSPVWSNSTYLNDLYSSMKRDYLKKAQKHSQVLVYDWSQPGDIETVVEDIEELNFDHYGLYDVQQSDWRLYNEDYANIYRFRYSRALSQEFVFSVMSNTLEFDAEKIFLDAEEMHSLKEVGNMFPGHDYDMGFNTNMGDSAFNIYMNPFYGKLQQLHNNWNYPFGDDTSADETCPNKFDYAP